MRVLANQLRILANKIDPVEIKHADKVSRATSNLYEAAYYMSKEAQIARIQFRKNPKPKADKQRLTIVAVIVLDNIPINAIGEWNTGTAQVNLRAYESIRRKLKKEIDRSRYA